MPRTPPSRVAGEVACACGGLGVLEWIPRLLTKALAQAQHGRLRGAPAPTGSFPLGEPTARPVGRKSEFWGWLPDRGDLPLACTASLCPFWAGTLHP